MALWRVGKGILRLGGRDSWTCRTIMPMPMPMPGQVIDIEAFGWITKNSENRDLGFLVDKVVLVLLLECSGPPGRQKPCRL